MKKILGIILISPLLLFLVANIIQAAIKYPVGFALFIGIFTCAFIGIRFIFKN